jgi:hypothetical protein
MGKAFQKPGLLPGLRYLRQKALKEGVNRLGLPTEGFKDARTGRSRRSPITTV